MFGTAQWVWTTLVVMALVGLAACLNGDLKNCLLAIFAIGAFSFALYYAFPYIFAFVIAMNLKGGEENGDYEDDGF